MGNKQAMQTSQFGQNLDLENRELDQRGTQFDKTLGFQNRTLDTSHDEFLKNLGLQTVRQQQENELEKQRFGLQSEGQRFNQREQERLNVTPGSALWFQMQNVLHPAQTDYAANPRQYGGAANPISAVKFTRNLSDRLY